MVAGETVTLSGPLGVGVDKSAIATQSTCATNTICLQVNPNVNLSIAAAPNGSFRVDWYADSRSQILQDCFQLKDNQHWYGGPERWYQDWPIEKVELTNFANVAQELNFSAIVEPYWLNSLGTYIFVDDKVPLFIDQNGDIGKQVCFSGKIEGPFILRDKNVCIGK